MTIQQLEYILAVDQFRHFARAAEYCRVTQPTLSAMIQKLEDELGLKLFDRTVLGDVYKRQGQYSPFVRQPSDRK